MRLALVLATIGVLSGCAHYAARDNTLPAEPENVAGSVPDNPDVRNELLLRALGLVGIRYKYGGNSPATGFDCSGLVQYVYSQALGIALPRSVQEMSAVGNEVAPRDLQPGDLVFFNTLHQPFSHVGIYLGKRRFIHAPSRGGEVEVVSMTDRYWERRYDGARRLGF